MSVSSFRYWGGWTNREIIRRVSQIINLAPHLPQFLVLPHNLKKKGLYNFRKTRYITFNSDKYLAI